ncbi:hypothetical protein ACJZ2D_010328 [Fusarium nematophilum]
MAGASDPGNATYQDREATIDFVLDDILSLPSDASFHADEAYDSLSWDEHEEWTLSVTSLSNDKGAWSSLIKDSDQDKTNSTLSNCVAE